MQSIPEDAEGSRVEIGKDETKISKSTKIKTGDATGKKRGRRTENVRKRGRVNR